MFQKLNQDVINMCHWLLRISFCGWLLLLLEGIKTCLALLNKAHSPTSTVCDVHFLSGLELLFSHYLSHVCSWAKIHPSSPNIPGLL